jgi:competence protein ComEA
MEKELPMLNYNKFNGHKENFSKLIRSGAFVLLASSSLSLLASPTSAFAQAQTSAEQAPAEIQPDNRVNINTADAETLALALDGIGMAKAQEIIVYREQNGDFKTIDELQNVRGIGKATLERNRSRILISTITE